MNHENHSHDPERHEQHPHVSNQSGQDSGRSSSSAEYDEERTCLPKGKPVYHPPGEQALPGLTDLSRITEWRFESPTPMPQIIQWHNNIKPGSGDRIMDDAHEDIKLDRQITSSSFEYAIHESKVRLYTAIGLCISAVILVPIILLLFEPPESIVGTSVVGAIGLSPLVGTLLNGRGTVASPQAENGSASSK